MSYYDFDYRRQIGNQSTNEDVEEERKKYDEEFISITRKEFETAVEKKHPSLYIHK